MAVVLAVCAGLLMTLAVVAAGAPRPWVRRRIGAANASSVTHRQGLWLSAGAALGVATLIGGAVGWILGATVAYGTFRWQRTLGSRDDQLDETRRALAMPVALDLLSACLSVGATQHQALAVVADTLPGSLRRDLATVAGAMGLGAGAAEAWSLVDAPDLQALRAVFTRVDVSGAPVGPLLAVLAEQHRGRARVAALDASRALGVRLAGPLGLCFLPAFVLIAVVPLVVSLLPFRV